MSRVRRASPLGGRSAARGATVPRTAAAGTVLALVLLVGSAGAPATALSSDDPGTLSVTITDGSTSTPSASPSPFPSSPPPAGSSPGTGGSAPAGGTGAVPLPAPGTGGSTGGGGGVTGSTEVSVAGMVYVGGLNASAYPEADPSEGIVDVWFTVRNASSTPIDATADFWVDSVLFPQRLDAVDDVAVTALQPGESRVVATRLRHGGQWTLLSTHVTLTPPESVDGVALTPVTRDALALLFPWVIVALVLLSGLAVAVVQTVRRSGSGTAQTAAAT